MEGQVTGTIVGRRIRAGNGGMTYLPDGPLMTTGTVTIANGANTNYLCTQIGTLKGNTLANLNDKLRAIAYFVFSSSTDSKVYTIAMGGTCTNDTTGPSGGFNISSNASTTVSTDARSEGFVVRTAATTYAKWANSFVFTATPSAQLSTWGTGAVTWASDQPIFVAIRDQTAGTAGAITFKQADIYFEPAP